MLNERIATGVSAFAAIVPFREDLPCLGAERLAKDGTRT